MHRESGCSGPPKKIKFLGLGSWVSGRGSRAVKRSGWWNLGAIAEVITMPCEGQCFRPDGSRVLQHDSSFRPNALTVSSGLFGISHQDLDPRTTRDPRPETRDPRPDSCEVSRTEPGEDDFERAFPAQRSQTGGVPGGYVEDFASGRAPKSVRQATGDLLHRNQTRDPLQCGEGADIHSVFVRHC